MTTSSEKANALPQGLVTNLQEVLQRRKGNDEGGGEGDQPAETSTSDSAANTVPEGTDEAKPVVLVTSGDGIDSPGLLALVDALVRQGLWNVYVVAPQSDKSVSSHSVTLRETVAVTSTDIEGAVAFEVSGTPVDCVSLAVSGALFPWSKPTLVISGINRGSSCGHNMFYSGVVAAAREALMLGIPSLSISLNWKQDESQENDLKDAVGVCLPIISAVIRDIEKGTFPESCFLNIGIPTSPSTNKGFKITKTSMWRSIPSWQAISATRHPAANFMSNQQSFGMQLAQLSRDASAAGAARRLTTQRKSLVEVESVGIAGKPDNSRVKKYFRMEFQTKEHDEADENSDFKALEDGFVSVTPISLLPHLEPEIQAAASEWIDTVQSGDQ